MKSEKEISGGTVHKLPDDLKKNIATSLKALLLWEDITPLARNEWICWVESVKREGTRKEHLERVVPELIAGIRRPCCWIGCIHRTDRPMTAAQKYILGNKMKKVK